MKDETIPTKPLQRPETKPTVRMNYELLALQDELQVKSCDAYQIL